MAEKQEIVFVSARQAAAKQLAAEIAERKKTPLDKTIPGGAYLRADKKTWENANGEEIDPPSARALEAAHDVEAEPEAAEVIAPAAEQPRPTRATRAKKAKKK